MPSAPNLFASCFAALWELSVHLSKINTTSSGLSWYIEGREWKQFFVVRDWHTNSKFYWCTSKVTFHECTNFFLKIYKISLIVNSFVGLIFLGSKNYLCKSMVLERQLQSMLIFSFYRFQHVWIPEIESDFELFECYKVDIDFLFQRSLFHRFLLLPFSSSEVVFPCGFRIRFQFLESILKVWFEIISSDRGYQIKSCQEIGILTIDTFFEQLVSCLIHENISPCLLNNRFRKLSSQT